MRGKRHSCLSTVCEKTLPPIPASLKVKKIAGIAGLVLHFLIIMRKCNARLIIHYLEKVCGFSLKKFCGGRVLISQHIIFTLGKPRPEGRGTRDFAQ